MLSYIHFASPSPEANASAVRSRWQKWSTVTAAGPGPNVDSDRHIGDALATKCWRTLLTTHGNLGLRDCAVGMECRVLGAADQRSDDVARSECFGFMRTRCAGHNCALAMKPMCCHGGIPAAPASFFLFSFCK